MAVYYLHSPCNVKAAQQYGLAQPLAFHISICAARNAAAGRKALAPSMAVENCINSAVARSSTFANTRGAPAYMKPRVSPTSSADSGTWTATETSLTAHSRSGQTTVYQLEKRNHPKNGDPMLVLNGQAFVTYYQHASW